MAGSRQERQIALAGGAAVVQMAPVIAESTKRSGHAVRDGMLHGIPQGFDFRIGVRSARNLRRLRRSLFGYELYSGPAWEILLHLFESHVLERRDTVGNVTDGTELPGATSLRWMARLEQEGLICLRDDHLDRRRRWVELTQSGIELMSKYFAGVAPNLIAA